jgi:hypothetical protein
VRRLRPWWAVGVGSILLAGSLLTPQGRHEWSVSLFRQPSAITTLSFADPSALPAEWTCGRTLPVQFVVENRQGRTADLHYVVTQEDDLGARAAAMRAQGTLTVADGTAAPVTVQVRPDCPATSSRIRVSVVGHPQTIFFHVRLSGNDRAASDGAAGTGARNRG